EDGTMLRFVDTTPLVWRLEREIGALRKPQLATREPAQHERQRRIVALEKALPALSMNGASELRRHPRKSGAAHAVVRVGIANVCAGLAKRDGIAMLAFNSRRSVPREAAHEEATSTLVD